MNTGLTERGALQAAFNLWDDLAKHGYWEKGKSEYCKEAEWRGHCILCAYYECCNECALGKKHEGKFFGCTSNPDNPYYLWGHAETAKKRRRHARAIATRIKKRLDEVTAAEEGNHA
jgi:hypothetical protein